MEASKLPEEKIDSMEEESTPTDTEVKSILENEVKEEKVFRIHISPPESDNSSGGTTPDACLLNTAPFELKLLPKCVEKRNTSDITPDNSLKQSDSSKEQSKELSQSSHLTPTKPSRPINFNNLSPRNVVYKFSEKYPSGVLRPSKVRRKFDTKLMSFSASDLTDTQNEFEKTKRIRCHSDKLPDRTGMYENVSIKQLEQF